MHLQAFLPETEKQNERDDKKTRGKESYQNNQRNNR